MSANLRAATQLVGLAVRELELCQVGPEDTVLIYSDPDSRPDVTAALFGAATSLTSNAFEVTVPSVRDGRRTGLPPAVAEMAGSVDLMVDATRRGMLHGGDIERVLSQGVRMLRVREPAAVLARLFPDESVGARISRSGELLEEAAELRFRSAQGTDLLVQRGARRVLRQYGYCAEAGDWDHWGTALATFSPPESAAEGRLVLGPGDVFFLTATVGIYVAQPIVLAINQGMITGVEGGGQARQLERMLRAPADPDAGCISHVGWGGDPRADWNALTLYEGQDGGGVDLRSFCGGVVIAFGSNVDMGGTNTTTFHMDLAFRDMSVELDGRPVLEAGEFVLDELRSPLNSRR
jgi:2,5-dihydroxypyridine 5,6-dioxygenase